jgi:LacI family transcriptional regulator
MSRALDEGLRIPEDLAIIGCGNLHYDDALRVPLSSIDQQSRRLGEEAGRITLGILNSKTARKSESVLLEPQLIARASTQRRAAKHAIARPRAR